jgi:hypothetical protein
MVGMERRHLSWQRGTNDAKHDMTPEELLTFCRAVIAHSSNWQSDR